MRHLIDIRDLSMEEVLALCRRASDYKQDRLLGSTEHCLKGKVVGTVFYEPSTRTRFSFESAAIRLGGHVIGTENAREFSSVSKGESPADTIRTLACYCDCIIMRNSEEGLMQNLADISSVPLINAGDGSGQHPTQALLDLYTIIDEFGDFNKLNVILAGDMTGRTINSLAYLLGKAKGVNIKFISPKSLRVKDGIKDYLAEEGIDFSEDNELDKHLGWADVVYMTRMQRERMNEQDCVEALKTPIVINTKNLNLLKPTARILHPLPHVSEIVLPIEVESKDPRIAYFRQVKNGLYMRMALLEWLIE